MNPAAERLLRALARAGTAGSLPGLAVTHLVNAVLAEEGLSPEEPVTVEPLTAAERAVRYRERKRHENRHASRDGRDGRDGRVVGGKGGLLDSLRREIPLSSHDLDPKEERDLDLRERAREPGTVTKTVTPSRDDRDGAGLDLSAQTDTRMALPAASELTDEMRAAAEMAGLTDVLAVWAKFRSIAVEKGWLITPEGWPLRWERFWRQELSYQRAEREKARESETRMRKAPEAPPPHEGPVVRAERKRREADYDKAKREAVPAPVGALLAALDRRNG